VLAALDSPAYAQQQPSAPGNAEVDQITADIVDLRGLPPLRETPIMHVDRSELATHLDAAAAPDFDEALGYADLLVLLGYVKPWDRDRYLASGALSGAGGVDGLYDPEQQTIFVVDDPPVEVPEALRQRLEAAREATASMVIAHEFTHALQDQHHSIAAFDAGAAGNTDQLMARHAIIEGDATFTSERWATGHLSPEEADQIGVGLSQATADRVGAYPYAIQTQWQFLYGKGAQLVAQGFERSGSSFRGVDALFDDPPASSEQVLHPEKYWQREPPHDVVLPDLAARLGRDWRTVSANVLGELGLELLLQLSEPPASASVASAGWGGDHWVVLERDGQSALVLLTTWDTEQDSREFFDALANGLRTRYTDARQDDLSPNRQALQSASTSTVTDLRWRGADVLLVASFDRATADALMEAIWN
jgi:hypothetical protein